MTLRENTGGSVNPRSLLSHISDWTARRSDLEIALVFYFFAFVVRLAVAFLGGINSPLDEGDPLNYFQHGVAISQGHGYSRLWGDGILRPTAGQMPGTSAFIALGVLLFGKQPAAARLMAAVISSFSAAFMYIFARRVASRGAALLAGLACALYPTWLFYSTTVMSEPYFIPLLLLSLHLTASTVRSPTSWTALVAGLAWGASTLVRPHGAPMAVLIGLYLVWRSEWRRALVLLFGFALFVGPWVIRNQRIFGVPLLATEGGETFLGSNNPYVIRLPKLHGLWHPPYLIPEYRAQIEPFYDELKRGQIENRIAWAYLRQNPGVVPLLAFYKLKRWLTPITESGGIIRLLVLASYGTLLLLLTLGWFRGIYRGSVELHLVSMWSMLIIAITVVYWGNLTRGRLPLELVWLPWASLTGLDIVKWSSAHLGLRSRS